MRSLTTAAAIATLILLGIPTAALAHRRSGAHCSISMQVAPREITAGDPVVIFGRLACLGGGAAGQTVRLYHHIIGLPGFTYVQSTTTDAGGFYEFARADGVVETNRAWFVRSHGAQSASRRIRVAAQVKLSGPAEGSQLLTGPANRVIFTGTVSPADVGARVVLQRQNAVTGSEWRRIDIGVVQPGGGFTIVHTFRFPGDANIRVLVRSQERNIPSGSTPLEYEISQAQNPALTIDASADPIPYGQSVTITGALAVSGSPGNGGRQLTLLARTRGQRFAPVAQTTTEANGNYSFPTQAPADSTFYRVIASGTVCLPSGTATPACPVYARRVRTIRPQLVESAVLYEGVRDILTAQVSASTVQAGGQLTFSGGVAPDHSGHVIYLQRENAAHDGFHVVQVALVGPHSTYSIVHRVYDAGMKVFRVYIPGGPENLGAASQPFTIQVTPAPAAALTPEAPGNSSLPAEGSEASGERGESESRLEG